MNICKSLRFSYLFAAFFVFLSNNLFSQNGENEVEIEQDTISTDIQDITISDTIIVSDITAPDTITIYITDPDTTTIFVAPDTTIIYHKSWKKSIEDVLYPPTEIELEYLDTVILNNISLPVIFYEDRVNGSVSLPELSFSPFVPLEKRFRFGKLFEDKYQQNDIAKQVYYHILDTRPDLVKYNISDFQGEIEKIEEMESNILKNLFQVEYDLNKDKLEKPERYNPKRKYWIWKGSHFIQFSQSDNSQNWSDTTRTQKEKGFGNMNLISVQGITATYIKNRILFSHSTEWRLNIANSMNDTLRAIKIAEDRLRSYSTFGITAYKNWSYSSNFEITTPILINYRENTIDTISSFLSPVKMNLGIGMKFQINKTYPKVRGKRLTLNTDINPLSVQYIYIKDKVLNPAQHGIKEPEKDRNLHLLDFGSSVNANLLYFFNKNVSLNSRVKYFTNYHKVNTEWESTLSMPINRYITTTLYFYLTFDDTRVKNSKFGYFNLNETFSLGFNYIW
jgi:hypothetical protein